MYVFVEMRRAMDLSAAIEHFAQSARVERMRWRKSLWFACVLHVCACAWLIVGACGIGLAWSTYTLTVNVGLCLLALVHMTHSYMQMRVSRDMLRRLPLMYRHGLRHLLQQQKQLLTAKAETP